jgi:uncharacterized membrane protein YbhN (UPF0104 family)
MVICAVLLAVAIKAEESMVAKSFSSFGHLHLRPLIFAVLMEVLSMVALGLMERRILIMGGLRIPVRRAIALAYASNAMSASLPMVGSGAASSFSYKRLVSQGATPAGADPVPANDLPPGRRPGWAGRDFGVRPGRVRSAPARRPARGVLSSA